MSSNNFAYHDFEVVMRRATEYANDNRHEFVTTEHVFLSILENEDVNNFFYDIGVPIEEIKTELEEYLKTTPTRSTDVFPVLDNFPPSYTIQIERIIALAVSTAIGSGRRTVNPIFILRAILSEADKDSFSYYLLQKYDIQDEDVRFYIEDEIEDNFGNDDESEDATNSGEETHTLKIRSRNSDEGSSIKSESNSKNKADRYEKNIEKYCENLNNKALAGKIDPLIGREAEIDALVVTVSRRTKNNCILIGDPGVGKTAIVEGLAKKIVDGDVPDAIKNAVIYSIDISSVMASTSLRGELEVRIKSIIESIEKKAELTDTIPILFIDEFHMIMNTGSGSNSSMDIANMLKNALARGTLRCVGSTTHEEYRKYVEKDRAIVRRFFNIEVNEPSVDETKQIIRGIINKYEEYHGVTYTDEAIDSAVELSHRYINSKLLPDKAIDLIDVVGARQKVVDAEQRQTTITKDMIVSEIARVARIPEISVKEEETEKLRKLKDDLLNSVFGQNEAIEILRDTVVRSRAGFRSTRKPQGCFLFVGPTGVGKTESARQLASTLGIPLHRFDMSEYMEKHSVSRLIGSPPGYVGYGEGGAGSGMLANVMDKSPHCVLLIDEIEKAHPDIYNIFLQIMDNGTMTTASGKVVDFRNCYIIMTTNAGASVAQKEPIGFGVSGKSASESKTDEVINKTFTPEFRNRLDAIVKFKHLEQESMIKVVDKFMASIIDQAKSKNVDITLTDSAKNYLATAGYDRKMGARPMERLIEKEIAQALAEEMLFGNLRNGGKVTFDYETKLTYKIDA